MEQFERNTFDDYQVYLQDKYRPPSRGGNTRAWHSHVIKAGGETYSFLALGARKWAFVGDTISFEWSWDKTNKYRDIDSDTFRAWSKGGTPVVRGIRGKKRWRTAPTKIPLSRVQRRNDDADFQIAGVKIAVHGGTEGDSDLLPDEITVLQSVEVP